MLQDNLDDYNSYLDKPISDRPSERVRNALLLAIVNSLSIGSNNFLSSGGGIPGNLNNSGSITPTLEVIENNGDTPIAKTIRIAKFASIIIKSGTGTILGAPVDEVIRIIDFPYSTLGWSNINYAVNPNSIFVVLVGR